MGRWSIPLLLFGVLSIAPITSLVADDEEVSLRLASGEAFNVRWERATRQDFSGSMEMSFDHHWIRQYEVMVVDCMDTECILDVKLVDFEGEGGWSIAGARTDDPEAGQSDDVGTTTRVSFDLATFLVAADNPDSAKAHMAAELIKAKFQRTKTSTVEYETIVSTMDLECVVKQHQQGKRETTIKCLTGEVTERPSEGRQPLIQALTAHAGPPTLTKAAVQGISTYSVDSGLPIRVTTGIDVRYTFQNTQPPTKWKGTLRDTIRVANSN